MDQNPPSSDLGDIPPLERIDLKLTPLYLGTIGELDRFVFKEIPSMPPLFFDEMTYSTSVAPIISKSFYKPPSKALMELINSVNLSYDGDLQPSHKMCNMWGNIEPSKMDSYGYLYSAPQIIRPAEVVKVSATDDGIPAIPAVLPPEAPVPKLEVVKVPKQLNLFD